MSFEELLNTAKHSLAERISSPLLGSIALSWCLWNWKFFVILFSANTVTQTFALVDTAVFPDAASVLTRGILYPLLTAAAYIFLYPYPSRFVYAYTLRRQREENKVRQQIADETPLTLEESRRLRAEYVQHERRNTELVQTLNEEIARLNAALEAAVSVEPPPPLTAPEKLYDRLEPTQLLLLGVLEKVGSPALEADLIKGSPEPKVKTEYDIGELERRKLPHRNYDQSRRGYTLEFTHAGRRALLESKKAAA